MDTFATRILKRIAQNAAWKCVAFLGLQWQCNPVFVIEVEMFSLHVSRNVVAKHPVWELLQWLGVREAAQPNFFTLCLPVRFCKLRQVPVRDRIRLRWL